MKLVKKLLVLAAAMTMVLSLVACGGEKFPQEYKASQPRGEGEQTMTLVLNEDGTYEWNFFATESNGSGNKVMECTATGTYTKDGELVTLDTCDGTGYYTAGASKTEFTFDKENPGMYENTDSLGSWEFIVADDGTFGPNVE